MSSSNLHRCLHPPSHVRKVKTHHDGINCSACECPISSENALNCSACNSDLHLMCKNRPPLLSSDTHPAHILSFLHFNPTRPAFCDVCDKSIRGVSYTCYPCNFDVHPECSQLRLHVAGNRPPLLSSDIHPAHILSFLHFNPTRPTTCDVCDERIMGVSYTCYPCDFDVHPECSQLPLHVPCNVNGRPISDPVDHHRSSQPLGSVLGSGPHYHNNGGGGGNGFDNAAGRRSGGSMGRFVGDVVTSVAKNELCDIISDIIFN